MDPKKEREILKSDEIYHLLFESMNQGFLLAEMVCDEQGRPVDFIILDTNPACEKQAGLDRKTLLGKHGAELLEKVEPKWLERFSEVSAGSPVRFEEYIIATDCWFEVNVYPLPQRNQFAMLLTDITERKRVEGENRCLEKFPSENPSPVLRLSLEGVILYANTASGALLSMWNCVIGGTAPESWRQTIARTFAEGSERLVDIECNERVYAFAIVPIMEAGYINMYGSDITERKRAENSLQARQEELTAANEELQAQQAELTSINEELLTQTEELDTTYRELQFQMEMIREHAEVAERTLEAAEREREAAGRARVEAERWAAELDATISSIASGVIIYDLSGNIIRMNEFARTIFGYSSTAALEKMEVYQPDGTLYQTGKTPLERALRGETIHDEEVFVIEMNSGRQIWLDSTFAPIRTSNKNSLGVVFTFTDITEQKRKVAEILASERELLQVTLNSLGEGVVACDQQGQIIFMNEAAANLTGYTQVEAIGEPFPKILHINGNSIFDNPGAPSFEPVGSSGGKPGRKLGAGVSSLKFDPILRSRDSKEIPIAMNHSPIKTPDGLTIGAVTVFQDISEKRKTEQELLRAGKLESLGILAGGIAHDFNNVLAAILSNVQLAMIKLKKGDNIEVYLANTVERARKASELTKQLLTFSKGGAPVKKDASLNDLIRDIAEFVLRGAKTKAEFAIPDDLWTASIDIGQISQVIHNLVLNAEQAMPRGGIIEIRAENVTLKENHQLTPGKYIKITVHDQGVGIPEENLVKIFDPYFTTKKDGNGLGLTTSYSIITRHNGYIDVESRQGAGASFVVYLPASNGVAPSAKPQPEVAASGSSFKILLMDDEEQILSAIGEMLQCFGHQVLTATDGAKAIEVYRRAKDLGVPFDVVIMDLTIPGGMGGQETIASLRDFDPKVRAIVSSGYANDPIMADFERYGFGGVVSKPYKIDELNEVLYRVIGRK